MQLRWYGKSMTHYVNVTVFSFWLAFLIEMIELYFAFVFCGVSLLHKESQKLLQLALE